MILVTATAEFDPATFDAIRPALVEMQKASRAEPGCHDYVFSLEIGEPGRFRAYELWDSMEALEAHFAMPHMARFQQALRDHPPRALRIEVHERGVERSLPSGPG